MLAHRENAQYVRWIVRYTYTYMYFFVLCEINIDDLLEVHLLEIECISSF